MSRNYEVSIEADLSAVLSDAPLVGDIVDSLSEEIRDASGDAYGIVSSPDATGHIFETFRTTLYGGDSDEQFAKDFADNVFGRIDYQFPLIIRTTYLDELPFDSYFFGGAKDEDDDAGE